jgi:hypothetical protein
MGRTEGIIRYEVATIASISMIATVTAPNSISAYFFFSTSVVNAVILKLKY